LLFRARSAGNCRSGKMSGVIRNMLSQLASKYLVEHLANNRLFQRFAVGTDAALKDIQNKAQQQIRKGQDTIDYHTKNIIPEEKASEVMDNAAYKLVKVQTFASTFASSLGQNLKSGWNKIIRSGG